MKKQTTPKPANNKDAIFYHIGTCFFDFYELMKKNRPGNTKLTVASAKAEITPKIRVRSSIIVARKA